MNEILAEGSQPNLRKLQGKNHKKSLHIASTLATHKPEEQAALKTL